MTWEEELRAIGADMEGHFLLTTGLHSNRFFLMARLTEHPERLQNWAAQLARQIAPYGALTVVGSAVGGIIPAYALASALPGSRALFAEKTGDGTMALQRGFQIEPGEAVVIIDDAVSTGSSLRKVESAVMQRGGIVRVAATLVDRSTEAVDLGVPFESVVKIRDTWLAPPASCPLCRQQVSIIHPKL